MERAVESRRKLGEFLKAKRASLDPVAFELPVQRRRRVAGLRREEVALLAGISVTWYTQIECGANITISPALLGRLAIVLRLTPVERAYIFTLGIEEMAVINTVLPELAVLADSRIVAESFEAEIALVLRTHRTIKTQIYSTVVHGTLEALRPQLDESRCPIGIWLHDDLAMEHRCNPWHSRASRAHAAFHREIDKVVHAGLAGDIARVENALVTPGRYVTASTVLERTFASWSAIVAA